MAVFRDDVLRCSLLFVLGTSVVLRAADLKPETRAAWDLYVANVDGRVKAASETGNFLWSDEDADRPRRLQQGEVIASQMSGDVAPQVPHGLVHDWIGAVFVPGATLDASLAFTRDFDQYPKWYGPTVAQAHLLCRDCDEDHFAIRYVRTVLFVTAVLDVEYETRYFKISPTREYSVTDSLRIQEVENAGGSDERKKNPNDADGYIWKVHSVTKFEQRDGGVYVEQENIALSRPIPKSLRWMVEPVIQRLSRNLLVNSLRRTRDGILESIK